MKIGSIEYLTPQEFAEAKGCSLKTVYNFINNGEDSDGYKVVTEVILKKTMINLNRYRGVLVGAK
jgi:DNA invertase Pin-like site-specific DNA recombinase